MDFNRIGMRFMIIYENFMGSFWIHDDSMGVDGIFLYDNLRDLDGICPLFV